jgi:N6-L-threonylcarbamoyladenine synthase
MQTHSSVEEIYILGIESSCDDTSAAVIRGETILSNVVAGQKIHEEYGGVVPELASRAHQQNILPVVDLALRKAGISSGKLSAIAFTRGPGLLGSLLVGTSFAKGLALANGIPLIEINHLQAHVLALFIREPGEEHDIPAFPFLCLLVSGGNSQIILVRGHLDMEIIGQTIDDAAGEAFDKCAKVMGLPYPGGPYIDKLAAEGDPERFRFTRPKIQGLDYSFSGLKTNFLYFLRDNLAENPAFIVENKADLSASLQKTIIDILMGKLVKASRQANIRNIAVAGGVSANSGLRAALRDEAGKRKWKLFIPKFEYTMDNAAMIAIAGYYKYLKGEFTGQDAVPFARTHL